MKTFTKEQLSHFYSRLHETNACGKHGAGNMAVCPKCDVVACRSCAGGGDCQCDKSTEPLMRDHLGALLSCFGVPASDKIHEVRHLKPEEEIEQIYLNAIAAITGVQ